jgi:hypothetical protein
MVKYFIMIFKVKMHMFIHNLRYKIDNKYKIKTNIVMTEHLKTIIDAYNNIEASHEMEIP